MNESTPQWPDGKVRRWLSKKRTTWTRLAAATLVAVIGLAVGIDVSGSSAPSTAAPGSGVSASQALGTNARSAPSPGGAAGAISVVSNSGLTFKTSAGQTVTVTYLKTTKYLDASATITKSSLKVGDDVFAYGITSSRTVNASQVIVEKHGSGMVVASSAVIAFSRGAPTNTKSVGTIPAGWTQGSGTIVSGTAALEATKAALEKYPGGIVDRVVRLSSGQYNVHYIGVNWPHHIFVNQSFKVVGAE